MSDSPKTVKTSFLVKEPPAKSSGKNSSESPDQLEQELIRGKIVQENLEKQVAGLKRENLHLNARIRGYQTLGQLLEEAKRELKHHRQRNSILQNKLDSLTLSEDKETKNGTDSSQQISRQKQNEMDRQQPTMDQSTDTQIVTTTDSASKRTPLGPNDTLYGTDETASNNAHLVTPTESQMAESKQEFMSDSKDGYSTEIDLSSTSQLPLQSHTHEKEVESLSSPFIQKKENNVQTVSSNNVTKDSSGFSDPSFVVLPTKTNDEPSSNVALWSMSDSNGPLSLPSPLSSIDASHCSGTYTTISQDEEFTEDPSEVAQQVKSISEALDKICNLSNQSTLASELAHIAAKTLKVEKQLRLKKTMSESLVADYEKLKKQASLILPEYEKLITQLRQENEKLLRRVRQLEHERDQLDVPHSRSSNSLPTSQDWIQVEKCTLTKDADNHLNEEKQTCTSGSRESDIVMELQGEIERLKERLMQMTAVNSKLDEHDRQLRAAHVKELTELRRKFFESQALLEREAQEAIKELKKRIIALEEEKNSIISNEVKRRERAEAEVSVVESAKKDLEKQIMGLKDQVEFYKHNPPMSSLQDVESSTDSVTALNLQELRSQFRLQRQQISIYHDDFQTERHDREKLVGEIDSLRSHVSRLKKELSASQERVQQLMVARQRDMERTTITLPPSHNLTYMVNPREVYSSPQVATRWQWQQVARKWRCPRCTYDNEPVRGTCELCGALKTSGAIYGPALPRNTSASRESIGTIEMDDHPLTSEQLVHRQVTEECDSAGYPSSDLSSPHGDNVLD